MKVIFFDIDGTITDFDGIMPDSALKGMKLAQKAGNKIVLCSGRSEVQINPEIVAVGFDAIVSAAGAHVSTKDEIVYDATMTDEKYHFLLDTLYEAVPGICIQTNEHVYVSRKGFDALIENTAKLFGENDIEKTKEMMGDMVVVDDLYAIKNPQKMFYHLAPWTVDEVNTKLGDYFNVVVLSFKEPNVYCGEITIAGVEKSTGMDALMKYYGLGREDSVCFGDGPNDFDMMKYAGIGICMGNGLEDLKKEADYVTDTVKNDGLYKGLEHFNLI